MTTNPSLPHFAVLSLALFAGSALAQSAAEPGPQLEQIVVTARKVEESAQSVPIAITALSGEQLRQQGVERVSDLQYSVPSLVFSQTATSSFSPLVSLRGQTQGTIAIAVDPSVGVYVDGVYLSGTAGLMSDTLVDIERVEVLKGPQGTLFGRNTTGGAISFFTKEPTDELEGELTIGAGNFDRRSASGVLNVPLIAEAAALRIAASTFSRDGFGKDLVRGARVGDQDIHSFRATLKLTPGDKLQVLLRGDYTKGEDNGLLTHPLYIVPDTSMPVLSDAAIGRFGANTPANRDAALAAYQALIARDPFSVAYNTPVFDTIESTNGSVTVSYDLGAATLKSITALRKTEDDRLYEVDASDLILFTSLTRVDLDQFTQELQLTGTTLGERLTYATGLYYYDLEGSESSDGIQFGYLTNGGYQITAADLEVDSWAAYGQATYELTDTVSLTAGLRYTDETKSLDALGGSAASANAPFVCQLPAALNPDLTRCRAHVETSGNNVSYTAAIDWEPSAGILLYARTGRGYKSGTINQRIIGTNPLAGNKVRPEDVTDYEVGIKSDWFERRLRVNADVYRSDYTDIQRSSVLCSPGCTSVLQNAASATIEGAELEVTAMPFSRVRLGLTAAYTDPKYDKYLSGGLDNRQENFLEVPEWTYSALARYSQPLPIGELHTQLDWSWRSEMDMAPQDYPGGVRLVRVGNAQVPMANGPGTPDSIRIQDSYGLLNGSIELNVERWNATFRFFGANLLDQEYFSHALGNANALGVTIGTPGAPRTWGFQVTVEFPGSK